MAAKHILLVIAIAFVFLGCKKDNAAPAPQRGKTTHSTSATVPAMKDKQAFVEKYVTFRRSYTALEYKIDYEDDTSSAPGPSSTGCDVRLYAEVPASEMNDWIAGLNKVEPPPEPAALAWAREIPNASQSLDGFVWYTAPPNVFGGSKVVGVSSGGGKTTASVFYHVICARN
jgi:hypothetical protein